jgi:hypothetical protein
MTDEINSPGHYMLFPGMEAIDVIKAALTPEEFAGYCKGNALKYRLRAGDKGPAAKCIAKANWYQRKLRTVTAEDFGQQNTIDYRDPRTVAGVDVSFETERHMSFAPVSLKPEERCPDCKFGCSVCADAPGGKLKAEVASA